MARRKKNPEYPGVREAEYERMRSSAYHPSDLEEPDFIGNAPNYDKFKGWDAERVLAWLNMD